MADRAIICVDDEPNILRALSRLTRREDYDTLTTTSPKSALEMVNQPAVRVVVSDQRMPEMAGTELLRRIRLGRPDVIRVILSGYADTPSIIEAINDGEVYRFLSKPWNDDGILADFRQCLEQYDLLSRSQAMADQIQAQNEELRRFNTQLEGIVRERTRSLELSHDLLYHLPVAVIGIDAEGTIVLQNRAAEDVCAPVGGRLVGDSLAQAFSEEVLMAVRAILTAQGGAARMVAIPIGSRVTTGRVTRLTQQGAVRGAVITFEIE